MADLKLEDMVLASVNDREIEPRDAFVRRGPERLKRRAPVIQAVDRADVWVWEQKRYPSPASRLSRDA